MTMTAKLHSENLDRLASLDPDLFNRDVLATWKLGENAVRFLVHAARTLQDLARAGISARAFDTGLGLSIFRDNSTRTRHAFRAGCDLIGLASEEMDESSSQRGHGETVRETAAMIAFGTEAIGIRDDIFLGEGHRFMEEVSAAVDEAHREGALIHRPAIVNLQSDLDHPTQAMSDLCHLAATWGGLEGLRGKKIAVTWAHSPSYGKPLSVPQGSIGLLTRFGAHVVLAHPEGYDLEEEPMSAARRFAAESGGSFAKVGSMEEAFADADAVYPKSWASAAVMRERTRLLRAGEKAALADLEKQALAENARHMRWECDEAKMARTRGGRALYMHCLPADITGVSCAHGEVSKGVFEKARLDTYREAAYKPYVIAAMILATRLRDPAAAIARMAARSAPVRCA
jgi:knotted carbamoyltransferase YgeW